MSMLESSLLQKRASEIEINTRKLFLLSLMKLKHSLNESSEKSEKRLFNEFYFGWPMRNPHVSFTTGVSLFHRPILLPK